MSDTQSNLSSPSYGYDMVVATSQAAINKSMRHYLTTKELPTLIVILIADANNNPQVFDYTLQKIPDDMPDPFSIPPDADPDTDPRIQKLKSVRFWGAIKATMGIPEGVSDPQIVELGDDTASVELNLYCSQFQVVFLSPGGGYTPSEWLNVSQQSGEPWVYKATTDMRLTMVADSAYSKLSTAIQQRISNMGGTAFSVQQLLFDLSNAGLSRNQPEFVGAPAELAKSILPRGFLGAYFAAMQRAGEPILGANIVEGGRGSGTLSITALNFMVNPPVGPGGTPVANPNAAQQSLATLNYLCQSGGRALPPAALFTWNWLDTTSSDGIAAINRTTLAHYIGNQLDPYVRSNCYRPSVRVWLSGCCDQNVHYSWSMAAGQSPQINYPTTGSTVLTFTWNSPEASDQAGLNGDMGKLSVSNHYTLTVEFSGTSITIVQHQVIYLYGRGTFGISSSGNILDKTITDVYTVAVDADGQLQVARTTSNTQDHSQDLSKGGFVNFWSGDLNSLIGAVKTYSNALVATDLVDIPVSVASRFVFPGGNSFRFSGAQFSTGGDLVGAINYDE